MEFLKTKWMSLPVWARQTIMEIVEVSILSSVSYGLAVLEGNATASATVLGTIVLKGVMKVIRSHPEIPIQDYVNTQSEK